MAKTAFSAWLEAHGWNEADLTERQRDTLRTAFEVAAPPPMPDSTAEQLRAMPPSPGGRAGAENPSRIEAVPPPLARHA